MGSKRNKTKRGQRSGTFNKAGGRHSQKGNIKQKILYLDSHGREKLPRNAQQSFFVSKCKKGGNFILKKLVMNAKKYKCVKDHSSCKIFFKSVDQPVHGSRIINLNKLKSNICELSVHIALCDKARQCAQNDETVVSIESERRDGFYSLINLKCNGCGQIFILENSEKCGDTNIMDINVRCVWGSMVTGGGCSSLNECMGTMGIPGISSRKYSHIENEIGKFWHDTLKEEILKAGEEERNLAIQEEDYCDGIPAVTVVVDGGWSKRSHKHTYNAMAGVGVIFGARTKKLLHIGIRNKLCYICSRAETENKKPKEHECFRNWDASAQAMESDIILEGFLSCEQKFGVRFMRMIGDGDSSVFASIVKNVPVWGARVEKLECANHAVKCLRSNLEKLVVEKPHYKGKGGLTKSNIRRITLGVRCAIMMRSKEADKHTATKKLKHDIKNAGRHVLGIHDQCSTDFCKNKPNSQHHSDATEINDETEENDIIVNQTEYWKEATQNLNEQEVEDLRIGGICSSPLDEKQHLLNDIFFFLNRMSEKSSRLIGNFTSNLAECWMSIRCKFDGGKMTNRCFSGSFYARCYGGALRTMLGPAWSPQVYSKVSGTRADDVFIQTYRNRTASHQYSTVSSSKPENKRKRKQRKMKSCIQSSNKKSKQEYGENVPLDTADIPFQDLQKECDIYFKTNIINSNQSAIEITTRGQSKNENWLIERKKRLTSSVFGEVMSRSINNNSPNFVKRLLYTKFHGNKYTLKGLNEEENARIEYINIKNQKQPSVLDIKIPGLIVSEQNPYLAASSDGIVIGPGGREGLIEIKTLLQTNKIMICQAAKTQKSFCLTLEEGQIKLKTAHKYYYQIQGQLNIIGLPWCDLVVRRTNPHDIFIQRIERDTTLWDNCMIPKLKAFYLSHILPELAVPRHGTITGIRKPAIPWVCPGAGCQSPLSSSVEQFEQVTGLRKTTRKRGKLVPETESRRQCDSPTPGCSTEPPCEAPQKSRTRKKKQKFVGRHINHQWTEADGSCKWYRGSVLSVTKGKDGDPDAVYEVWYDSEKESYEVDDMQKDFVDGTLKFDDM